jgi:hypothetical protein
MLHKIFRLLLSLGCSHFWFLTKHLVIKLFLPQIFGEQYSNTIFGHFESLIQLGNVHSFIIYCNHFAKSHLIYQLSKPPPLTFNNILYGNTIQTRQRRGILLPGPPLISISNGISLISRRAAGKSLLRHLKQRFANMPFTEFESSTYTALAAAPPW